MDHQRRDAGGEVQEPAHVRQRDIEGATVLDKGQTLHMLCSISAVAIGLARRRLQDPGFLVKANRVGIDTSGAAQFTDFHDKDK